MFTFDTQPDPYSRFFAALSGAREHFHTFGGIEDSNAKLDELLKLVALVLSERAHLLPVGVTCERALAKKAFESIKRRPEFDLDAGGSIFDENSPLRIAEESDELFQLFRSAAEEIVLASEDTDALGSDLLNEAFGHFIRENFRSNTEDAQFMTPPEVTSFMVELALHQIDADPQLRSRTLKVADPSCGVSSFLLEFEKARRLRDDPEPTLIGQDKVRRMLRLAHVSGLCAGLKNLHLGLGNSLADSSWLSGHNGTVDIVLTNPPFGARFERDWLRTNSRISLPFFAGARAARQSFDSEYLFLDRYLTLLRPGGIMLVVLPDGIVGGTGLAAMTRHYLSSHTQLVGVYHLPSVAFAQAGTRTRTSIIILRKASPAPAQFAGADVTDLGFEVVRRKGVAIKRISGVNQLESTLQLVRAAKPHTGVRVLESSPLIVAGIVDGGSLRDWNVKQFTGHNDGLESTTYDHVSLDEVAHFPSTSRKTERYESGTRYLSILHLVSEGVWDHCAIETYRPITPGTPARSGEVVISKINPRIPRVGIVPEFPGKILVSTEFEILAPKNGISAAALCFLLRDKFVQSQIEALTSGTSASHNRVRGDKLKAVKIRVPRERSLFDSMVAEYEVALASIERSLRVIRKCRAEWELSAG